jgi:homoserine dehydrogenase
VSEPVRIGVLGCGNVGAAFVELVRSQGDAIERRTGMQLVVSGIAVRTLSRERTGSVPEELLTRDAAAVIDGADLVVEVIGGIEPAREWILAALAAGKPVVTANKELLANHGAELYAAAEEAGRDLLFEAAVAGGIPLIRPLRESLIGEPIARVMGIVNGTTNFILTKMTDEGAEYADALAEAQQLGFAERDPTADVEGFDAGAKAAIIASIAFGARVRAGDVHHEGISQVTAADIAMARRLGFVVKLLAVAEEIDGEIAVRVHPTMVPTSHPLASVSGSYNAVFIEGQAVGSLMFYGRGAGGSPTASAVLGDVIDAAINRSKGTHASLGSFAAAPIRSIDETFSSFYVPLEVEDRPGVLAQVASAFANHSVSIRTAEQEGTDTDARLVFITHAAREADVRATLRELRHLDTVKTIGGVLRVIGA